MSDIVGNLLRQVFLEVDLKDTLTFQNGHIDPVRSLPYFHGNITKDEAVAKLKQGKPQ